MTFNSKVGFWVIAAVSLVLLGGSLLLENPVAENAAGHFAITTLAVLATVLVMREALRLYELCEKTFLFFLAVSYQPLLVLLALHDSLTGTPGYGGVFGYSLALSFLLASFWVTLGTRVKGKTEQWVLENFRSFFWILLLGQAILAFLFYYAGTTLPPSFFSVPGLNPLFGLYALTALFFLFALYHLHFAAERFEVVHYDWLVLNQYGLLLASVAGMALGGKYTASWWVGHVLYAAAFVMVGWTLRHSRLEGEKIKGMVMTSLQTKIQEMKKAKSRKGKR